MIYPKCLYKTREISKVAQNEDEHKLLALQGWKDIWTDKTPHLFITSGGNIGITNGPPDKELNIFTPPTTPPIEKPITTPKKKRSRRKKGANGKIIESIETKES